MKQALRSTHIIFAHHPRNVGSDFLITDWQPAPMGCNFASGDGDSIVRQLHKKTEFSLQ